MRITWKVALAAVVFSTVVCAASQAQSLKKDITVVHDYEPEYMDVSPLAVTPGITLPADTIKSLSYSRRRVNVIPETGISRLEPAAYADSIYASPYRGYAVLGFMPKFNMGASAGYKILDTDRTRINAWLQYDGTVYSNSVASGESDIYVRRHAATVGSALHRAVGRQSYVDLAGSYTYNNFNTPVAGRMEHQSSNAVNVAGLWKSSHKAWNYGAGADYGYFSYTNGLLPEETYGRVKPVSENRIALNANADYSFGSGHKAGADFRYIYASQNGGMATGAFTSPANADYSMLTLTPWYRFDVSQFHLDLGARLDLRFSDAGNKFRVAPAVKATWTAMKYMKVYIKATGGEWENTPGSLMDVTAYALPVVAYGNSNVPIECAAGLTVGNWRGLYSVAEVSYSIANDWLMPLNVADGTVFAAQKMRGLKVGVKAGYRYRDIAGVEVSYATAPQKLERGYYQWRDRARHVLTGKVTARPVKSLELNVSWTLRSGRAQGAIDQATGEPYLYKLGNISNLSAGALYSITDQWSVFVTGDNLLNRKYSLIGGVPGQGLTGLVGATYKF